jgi:hypothetical protein
MIRAIFSAKGAMLAFIVMAAATTTGCITTNVECGEGGPDGAGGCWTKSYVGQSVNGQACQSGNVCRFPGNTCDMSNPSAKCTNTINSGVCACKCQ